MSRRTHKIHSHTKTQLKAHKRTFNVFDTIVSFALTWVWILSLFFLFFNTLHKNFPCNLNVIFLFQQFRCLTLYDSLYHALESWNSKRTTKKKKTYFIRFCTASIKKMVWCCESFWFVLRILPPFYKHQKSSCPLFSPFSASITILSEFNELIVKFLVHCVVFIAVINAQRNIGQLNNWTVEQSNNRTRRNFS